MKKICIALDYNPSAEKVAKTGYAYAQALGAETSLVHVISDAAFYAMEYEPFIGYQSPFHIGNVNVVKELIQGGGKFFIGNGRALGQ